MTESEQAEHSCSNVPSLAIEHYGDDPKEATEHQEMIRKQRVFVHWQNLKRYLKFYQKYRVRARRGGVDGLNDTSLAESSERLAEIRRFDDRDPDFVSIDGAGLSSGVCVALSLPMPSFIRLVC